MIIDEDERGGFKMTNELQAPEKLTPENLAPEKLTKKDVRTAWVRFYFA